MRLLILGESDSRGLVMADPQMSWGNRIPAELGVLTDSDVETTHVSFYPWGQRFMAYLESTLARGPFDAVVLSATKAGFTTFSTHQRVRRLGGQRAGNWFLRAAKAFDDRTRWGKGPGLALSANQFAHRTMARVVGQAPPSTVTESIEGYREALARLARLEDTAVLVVLAPSMPYSEAARRPRLAAQVAEFRHAVRQEAERRRLALVDTETILSAEGPARDAMFIDGIHKSVEAHRLVANAAAVALAGALR